MRFYAPSSPVYYFPMRNILAITQANPCVITTTYDGIVAAAHNYLTGLYVRIIIPEGWGMAQLNKVSAPITVINATQFSIPIDSQAFDAYVIPAFGAPGLFGTPGQVVPIGSQALSPNQYAFYNTLT